MIDISRGRRYAQPSILDTHADDSRTVSERSRGDGTGGGAAINWRVWTRKCHRWGSILIALPFLLVILTGILLQVKTEFSWVQPPTKRGQGKTPMVSFDAILEAARSRPEAAVRGWEDIERIDVQPDWGVVKVQARSRWEVQVDLQTAEVLQVAYRRSDLIESLHDGSWFHDRAKLLIFLPVALVVLGLWVTGIYLFFLPYAVRWSRLRANKGVPTRE